MRTSHVAQPGGRPAADLHFERLAAALPALQVHPTVISDAFGRAAEKAVEVRWLCSAVQGLLAMRVAGLSRERRWLASCPDLAHARLTIPMQILTASAIPVSIEDREQLIRAANTSLSSKIISQNSRWGRVLRGTVLKASRSLSCGRAGCGALHFLAPTSQNSRCSRTWRAAGCQNPPPWVWAASWRVQLPGAACCCLLLFNRVRCALDPALHAPWPPPRSLLSPMAVDCLLKILDPQRPDLLDLKDVKVRRSRGFGWQVAGAGGGDLPARALDPDLLDLKDGKVGGSLPPVG